MPLKERQKCFAGLITIMLSLQALKICALSSTRSPQTVFFDQIDLSVWFWAFMRFHLLPQTQTALERYIWQRRKSRVKPDFTSLTPNIAL